jgi:hypothetical protein
MLTHYDVMQLLSQIINLQKLDSEELQTLKSVTGDKNLTNKSQTCKYGNTNKTSITTISIIS